ncbi:unnamed protein product [Chironomus riparius]|uniref:Uncharacterized protein n=1 Tax=Chironomus riparius TaxID=315576 RepID=A0A9N9RQJ1_9DIPT|nr:unnamed protein product [Chironomus riparius]
MKFGLGILVLYLTVYTAKSLSADVNNRNNYNESSDVMEQQKKSDLLQKAIDVPEIKINLLPTTTKTTSSILNKLLPHESLKKDELSLGIKRVTLLPPIPPFNNFIFMQQDKSDDKTEDVQRAEMIEIEVPMIGKEYQRRMRERADVDIEDTITNNAIADSNNNYVEINMMPTTSTTVPDTTEQSTFIPDFQTFRNSETNPKSYHQTSSSSYSTINDVSSYSTLTTTDSIEDMHAIESKLMDQYHSSHNSEENVDESLIDKLTFEIQEAHTDEPIYTSTHKKLQQKFPFNVKVVVNNEDQKTSCKNKQSCSQVNFSKKPLDIDQEYYKDDSDEDIFFKNELDMYNEKPNQLKSRRAADDGFYSPFNPLNTFNGFSLTPAPRFSGINNNFRMPNMPVMNRKPSFLERLENESSLEKSERVNKDLNNLMKFVAVWAHVDKFVSERARTAIKKLAYMTDEDYVDNFIVGSRKRVDNNLNTIAKNADEPFT